jgi:hypothetical protein
MRARSRLLAICVESLPFDGTKRSGNAREGLRSTFHDANAVRERAGNEKVERPADHRRTFRRCSTGENLKSTNADRKLGLVGAAGLEPATR